MTGAALTSVSNTPLGGAGTHQKATTCPVPESRNDTCDANHFTATVM